MPAGAGIRSVPNKTPRQPVGAQDEQPTEKKAKSHSQPLPQGNAGDAALGPFRQLHHPARRDDTIEPDRRVSSFLRLMRFPDRDAVSRSPLKRWRLPTRKSSIALIADGPQRETICIYGYGRSGFPESYDRV